MSHWMFHCKDVSRKVSEGMDRKLPLHHRMFIRVHLMMCKNCTRFRQQLLLLRKASRIDELTGDALAPGLSLSMEARVRMKEALMINAP